MRPECCTEHLMEVLTFADDLLTRHGIVHWLDFGTLLGAVRDQALIPWDGDADVGALERDRDALTALIPEIRAAGYDAEMSAMDGIFLIKYSSVNDNHVDIYLWSQRDGELDYQDDPAYAWPGMGTRMSFSESYLENLTTVQLYGRSFPAPAPADRFLIEHRYGPDYMKPVRPILSVGLYPTFDLDEVTPVVEQLLDDIARRDARLAALRQRSGWGRHRAVELWQKAGFPVWPDERRLRGALDRVADAERTPAVATLSNSLALLDQAIAEYEHPTPALVLRRAGRRLVRIREWLAARLARRPHRAGFPFGVVGGDK